MPKTVLRWPLTLDTAGRHKTDTSHQTGMRLITTLNRRTILGRPDRGLTFPILEQSLLRRDAEQTLVLATLFLDITDFLPAVALLQITAKRPDPASRELSVDIEYLARTDLSTKFAFTFALGADQ